MSIFRNNSLQLAGRNKGSFKKDRFAEDKANDDYEYLKKRFAERHKYFTDNVLQRNDNTKPGATAGAGNQAELAFMEAHPEYFLDDLSHDMDAREYIRYIKDIGDDPYLEDMENDDECLENSEEEEW